MNDYDSMTLFEYQDINARYNEIRKLVAANSSLLYINRDEGLQIEIRGVKGNPKFHFSISNPVKKDKKVVYEVDYAPCNNQSNLVTNHKADSENVIRVLKPWINLMVEHLTKKGIHPIDSIQDQYEREFDDWFEIVDEDADSKAFDLKRQLLISKMIDRSVEILKLNGLAEDDELIGDAETLKKDISKLTKRGVVSRLKPLYAKLKIMGLDKLKLVYDVCEKEMIKQAYHLSTKVLSEGLSSLLDIMDDIS